MERYFGNVLLLSITGLWTPLIIKKAFLWRPRDDCKDETKEKINQALDRKSDSRNKRNFYKRADFLS
jgi:hypothetical protein